ncbi:hypothetical protein WME75_33385 [Sorangium sp. So ce1014]|uniref:hypothetical protein n=1 Tax=Sorangium sp. So ce1014 TaxID=3133326 RepID=UPI003F5DA7AA
MGVSIIGRPRCDGRGLRQRRGPSASWFLAAALVTVAVYLAGQLDGPGDFGFGPVGGQRELVVVRLVR